MRVFKRDRLSFIGRQVRQGLKRRLICLLLVLLWFPGLGADKSAFRDYGARYLRNYSSKDYDHHPLNWAFTQDKRGVIYIGNHAGVIEYDSVTWRIIYVPNMSVRSLGTDETGTVYVGGKDEIGYLAPDPIGTRQYVSLLHYLKDEQKNFSNVWTTLCTPAGVYFVASKCLFFFNPQKKEMKVWPSAHPLKSAIYFKDTLYVHQAGAGLVRLSQDALQPAPGGQGLADKDVFLVCPYDREKLLLGTRTQGFFIYDGSAVLPFPTEVDGYVKENLLYQGTRLSNSDFALATLKGGLVIIDRWGKLKYIYDKVFGLQDEDVKNVFEDAGGSLWLALSKGITKIEYRSPFSIYDEHNDLTGITLSVARIDRDLYVGTTNGLFYLAGSTNGKFLPVPGITRYCWALLADAGFVLAATSDGIFQVQGDRMRQLSTEPVFALLKPKNTPGRTWAAADTGLIALRFNAGTRQWQKEFELGNFPGSIRSLAEDRQGNVWLGTLTRGAIKLEFPGEPSQPVKKEYYTEQGLPAGEVFVAEVDGRIMVGVENGIMRLDDSRQRFVTDFSFGKTFANGELSVFRIAEDGEKNTWFHARGKNYRAVPVGQGKFNIIAQPFMRAPTNQVNTIYPDPVEPCTWFAANYGLIRYDAAFKKDYGRGFGVLVRRVQLITDKRIIYDGDGPGPGRGVPKAPVFDYKDRNIRFEYAAQFYEAEEETQYQHFLAGYDGGWSEWSKETRKDYTNLNPGRYTFHVRARNVYETQGNEASYRFRVLPPWYRTWWAYTIFFLILFILLFLLVMWRSRQLVKEKQRLEQVVDDRTRENKDKNLQLEEQSGKLQEMDRIKSRFFANISHEFRTPLTLIMGPLQQWLSGMGEKEQREEMEMMLRNSQRLLTLINQLLDLSRLDSGKMPLAAAPQDLVPFLKGLLAAFASLALKNNLELSFETGAESIIVFFDSEKLEKIFSNLLSNACKFTPAGGEIKLMVKSPGRDTVEIAVSDTGIGMDEEQLAHIFDRFYQVENTGSRRFEGTGIGLSLVKELVELHRGTITVRSRPGQGSEFTVSLRLGAGHLLAGEIVAPATGEIRGVQEAVGPAGLEEPGPVEEEAEDKEDKTGEKPIILVVEDNADMRRFIKGPLKADYRVVEAADGREGIDKAREIVPDLIISDVMMPRVDGFELCAALKKDIKTSHIPIVLLTARTSETSVIEGFETGADDYITKPFNRKILATRIKNLIDLRRALQEKIQRELHLQPTEIAVSSIDQAFMGELKGVLDKYLSDPEFNVEILAKKLYLSQSTLYRKVLALTGEAPIEFIRSYRLKRATQLLKANFGNVTEVAFGVGFSSTAYFTKCFKEKFHQLPSAFQAAERSNGHFDR